MLVRARRDRRPVDLPARCRPRTLAEAYAIQEGVTLSLGEVPVGWKIGATEIAVREREGFTEPVSGRLFEGHVHHSPADLPAHLFTTFRNCETEIAVVLARDLPAGGSLWSVDAARGAVASVHPAIEVGDTRHADRAAVGGLGVVADNSGGTELVLGPAIENWRELDLASVEAVLEVDGRPIARGAGSDVMGDPMAALAWLAHHLASRGIGLRAGEIVTTGSWTGINRVPPDATARADFGPQGEVVVRFRNAAPA